MNKKKNRVYTATADEDYGCIYIAAKSVKEAKQIALTTWIAETMENYIDLKVKWQKGIEELKQALQGNINAFAGNSGVREIYFN